MAGEEETPACLVSLLYFIQHILSNCKDPLNLTGRIFRSSPYLQNLEAHLHPCVSLASGETVYGVLQRELYKFICICWRFLSRVIVRAQPTSAFSRNALVQLNGSGY